MKYDKTLACSLVGASIALAGGLAMASNVALTMATFGGLGFPLEASSGTPASESKAGAVSDNGVVAGMCLFGVDNSTPTTGYRATRWNGTDWQDLGTLNGPGSGPFWFSSSQGISADGSVVVGGSSSASGQRAFRWTSAGGMVSLGTLPGNISSRAHGVSSSGLVVVGTSTHPNNGDRAFRWIGGVMTNLGTLKHGNFSDAWGVSDNGLVVAGLSNTRNGTRAFRWTSAGMQDLGAAVSRNTSKGDISGDGLVVVGATGTASGPVTGDRAFRWTASTGMVNLGTLQSGWGSWASGTNQNGSMIVGSSGTESHPSNNRRAFLWVSGQGMVDLNTYLPTLGIDLTGWTLTVAAGISPDGETIVGNGVNEFGQTEAWVAHLMP